MEVQNAYEVDFVAEQTGAAVIALAVDFAWADFALAAVAWVVGPAFACVADLAEDTVVLGKDACGHHPPLGQSAAEMLLDLPGQAGLSYFLLTDHHSQYLQRRQLQQHLPCEVAHGVDRCLV